MYSRDRGGGGGGSSKAESVGGPLDRKRINDALDKHLEKSSPSNSTRGLLSTKDKERIVSMPSTSSGKSQPVDRSLPSKNKCSDGVPLRWYSLGRTSLILIPVIVASDLNNPRTVSEPK
ncbi:hypothetical protein C3L33_08142, partial [Rhododendron williamsianum]